MSECTLRRCISDCAHALPALLCIRDVLEPSLSYALYQTRMVILNFDAWCSIMKNITTSLRIWATDVYCVITLLLSIGTVQGSTDICLFLVLQLYVYLYGAFFFLQLIYIYIYTEHTYISISQILVIMQMFTL